MSDFKENCLEWLTGQDTITATLTQKRFINRVRRLSEQDGSVQIVAENKDGSIVAHLPIRALHLFLLPQNSKRPPWLSDTLGEDETDED